MKTYTTLVSYLGNVYNWETQFDMRRKRMAEIVPVGGGTVIAVRICDLRVLPSPGLKTTYAYAGSS